MGLFYNENKFQYTVPQSLPFGEVRRGFFFNAFNCMKAYSFNGERYGYYGYDASGERTYKYDIFSAGSWTNQTGGMNVSLQIDKMMLYPNGYMNINQNGEYTKHYYADALRIASKIGKGFSGDICDSANIINNAYSNYLSDRITYQSDIMTDELNEVIVPLQDIQNINFTSISPFCNIGPGGNETDIFFYHPDHLGSTGVVTDNNANVTQGFLYTPFGELMYEHNPAWQNNRVPKYAFNAKELDEENNMYYYSARYYAPPTFISRDPMFEKYPSISPYTYCANNPMKFVDPTGEDIYGLDENTGRLFLVKQTKDKFDVVQTGTFGIGRAGFKKDANGQSHTVEKGILNATNKNQDISKTGFVAGGGKAREGIELAKFISFNTGREVSGVGYKDDKGKDAVQVFAWDKNTAGNSKNPSSGYDNVDFHFHTHVTAKGYSGQGNPSNADFSFATTMNDNYGKTNMFIISQKEGVVRYNQFGRIPIGVAAPAPESFYSKQSKSPFIK